MKRILCSVLVFIMLAVSGCSTAPEKVSDDEALSAADVKNIIDRGTIRVGVKDEVPNFSYLDSETVQRSGMEIELAYKIGAKLFAITPEQAQQDGRIEFVTVASNGCEDALDRDKVDLVIATFPKTEERAKKYFLSQPYAHSVTGVIAKGDITTMDQLDQKGIMVLTDMTGRKDFEKYLSKRDKKITPDIKEFSGSMYGSQYYSAARNEVMKDPNSTNGKPLSEEVSAVVGDKAILSQFCVGDLHMLDDTYGDNEYVIASNKNTVGLAQIVDNTINAMIENGEMSQLRQKWNISE